MDNPLILMTKIIATLGPATSNTEMIKQLITSGVRVFRINFSHGSFGEYDQLIENIRQAQGELKIHVGILGDLSGPKIRVGKVVQRGILLEPGKKVNRPIREVFNSRLMAASVNSLMTCPAP